jgi:hypothetical protein
MLANRSGISVAKSETGQFLDGMQGVRGSNPQHHHARRILGLQLRVACQSLTVGDPLNTLSAYGSAGLGVFRGPKLS